MVSMKGKKEGLLIVLIANLSMCRLWSCISRTVRIWWVSWTQDSMCIPTMRWKYGVCSKRLCCVCKRSQRSARQCSAWCQCSWEIQTSNSRSRIQIQNHGRTTNWDSMSLTPISARSLYMETHHLQVQVQASQEPFFQRRDRWMVALN